MIGLAVVGAIVVVSVVAWARRRGTFEREVAKRGWLYRPLDDELATTWTMPPFARLRTPNDFGGDPERVVRVSEVVTFVESGSTALSMMVTEGYPGEREDQVLAHHVVALHTRQGLPRTIARCGIDVYVLPAYEGLQRVREPVRRTRAGVVSILSDDPATATGLPFDRIAADLRIDSRLTVVTDGDWIYAYRPGPPHLFRLDSMIATVQKLARGIAPTRWPGPENPSSYVYGAL